MPKLSPIQRIITYLETQAITAEVWAGRNRADGLNEIALAWEKQANEFRGWVEMLKPLDGMSEHMKPLVHCSAYLQAVLLEFGNNITVKAESLRHIFFRNDSLGDEKSTEQNVCLGSFV